MTLLVPLSEADPATIGGKAEALRRLARFGLPVPPAWVVPVGVFQELLRAHGLWDAAVAGEPGMAERVRTLPLPGPLRAPAGLPPLLAVRSSAIGEDAAHASHAGQYSSVLGVGHEGLEAAVREVWASWFSPHARAYRGVGAEPAMAVLVQPLVDARVSGVLFTTNPVTGSWREMMVEAVWGLGERLAGGMVVPDRYRVRRPRRTPRPAWRVISAVPLSVEAVDVAEQPTQLVARRGAVDETPSEAPLARKLLKDELLEVCRWGLRAESLLGGPQDVEWALDRAGKLWMLQSRPITTQARLPRGGAVLWSRRFIGERWPEGATPLGWSIVAPVLGWFIDYPETSRRFLGGDPPLRLVRGHPYINATVFRHLAFKIPGAPPPLFMLDFFPPEEVDAWVRRRAAPPDLRVYGSIFRTTFDERRWRRFRWNPFTNWKAWDTFRDGLDRRLDRLREAPPERVVEEGSELLRDYVKVHITSLLFANMWFEIVAPRLDEAARARLVQPPAGSVTWHVNAELRALHHDPSRLPAFLARHGHRSSGSWEVFSPRWAEEPERVLRLAAAAAAEPAVSPPSEVEVERELGGLSPSLRYLVRLTRSYLRLREEQRYHMDRILYTLQRRLVATGERWFRDGREVRFLLTSELDGSLPPEELRRTARRRAAEAVDPAPPDFLVGDEALPLPVTPLPRHQALGVSPGVYRGRVRVLHHPEQGADLPPGTVLVTQATDPAWTPLFGRLGGLVLELGGQLSHGAVVAREYHVPAVANLPNATRLLRDGMEVTLDGRAGVVWVHG